MTESLFTVQTPSGGNGSDGGAAGITTATGMSFAINGFVNAVRFFATTTVGAGETYTAELWQATAPTTGTRLGVATAGSASIVAGTWNVINFGSPIAVTLNTPYYTSINNDHNQGRYVATAGFFSAGGLTNGNITAWQDGTDPFGLGTMRNGTFKDNSAPNNFPNLTSGAACYFVDVVFDTGAVTQGIWGVSL